uniref:Sugar phosphate transporter domain-containing protein n=1 Tax=Meloidogyne incognita TaxID=6306 RepID=A0A914L3N9_MELIC
MEENYHKNKIIKENDNEIKNDRSNKKCRIFWSIITILSVAISTGYGSQVKYSLLNDDPKHFFPPYTMMWFNNCCLLKPETDWRLSGKVIICFPLFLFYEKCIKKNQMSLKEITIKSSRIFSDDGFRFGPFFIKEFFFLCLYTFGNYSYALSLGKISSSAALTIRSFEVSVVYIFGRIVLKDKFNIFKTIAVFLAMIGVISIALDKEFAANIIGFLLVLLSCLSDSTYKAI